MITVRLSREAADFVRRETEYLRDRNPAAARNFVFAMKNARRLLGSFPEAGNQMHGLQITGSRTLVSGDYLLDYIFDGNLIAVLSIRHGRMMSRVPEINLEDDDAKI